MRDHPIELHVGGKALRAFRVTGRIAAGELFSFEACAYAESEPLKLSDLLGKPYVLTLRSPFGEKLVVRGVCMAVESLVAEQGTHFVLDLGPDVAPLTVGQDSYVFQEVSVVDIIKDVLDANRIGHVEWKTKSYPARPHTAQYRESDWAFIERLCADEGIYYWFDMSDDATKLVFADDSSNAPEIEGGAAIPFRDDMRMRAETDCVTQVKTQVQIGSDAVMVTDYDHANPKLALNGHATQKDTPGKLEIYDFPGYFETEAAGKARAELILESLRAGLMRVSGVSGGLRVSAGRLLKVVDHPNDSISDMELFCRDVIYEAKQSFSSSGGDNDQEVGLRTVWTCIPKADKCRMPMVGLTRSAGGPQTGVVCGPPGEEVHTDKNGMIRVQFYWDRGGKKDDKASTPMRVGQVPMGNSMVLPRVGWDLLVEHHEGDIDVPFIVSHLFDGQFKVPYALPANKTRTAWQTATTPGGGSANEVRFEDKKGSEEMFLNASKDMKVTVGDSKDEKVGNNHSHQIGANHDIKVGASHTVGVKADQQVSIGAAEMLTVSGSHSTQIVGANSETIGAARTMTVTGGHKVDADGGRSLTVGGSMVSVGALGLSRATLGSCSVTVGGAWISAAAKGLANITVGASAETIGGAKIQVGAAGVTLNVKGAVAETVGGAYVITAGQNAGETSGASLNVTVGGALIANAPNIYLEASSEISITVGGSSLTIKDGSIEVKAPAIATPGATVGKDGSAVHHNP